MHHDICLHANKYELAYEQGVPHQERVLPIDQLALQLLQDLKMLQLHEYTNVLRVDDLDFFLKLTQDDQ